MTWTEFWDHHSGGSSKEPFEKIYIEAPEDEAIRVFFARFGHNPRRVTCTCCGPDYGVSEDDSFAQMTGHHRSCAYVTKMDDASEGRYIEYGERVPEGYEFEQHPFLHDPAKYQSVDEFMARADVCVIRADEIQPAERTVDVPTQGYVWAG